MNRIYISTLWNIEMCNIHILFMYTVLYCAIVRTSAADMQHIKPSGLVRLCRSTSWAGGVCLAC